ncbi:1-deoxy-D-xylulose-5-phosphate reductoisomerase [Haematomicrobium sanguinis]|uniref:1-deoxy-D-xylulose-5-phosphate reductoisomerase n=1 Tax=Haematomicrobium sanguinis TaxID=479106 RepID=UPI0005516FCE|nr:1-deoxy-D-xylulose-5-phosphate reductoisomerase [Haematomicrobium sanguinis]
MRSVTILGSTGSIGTQALEVVAANPDTFRVVALTAGGSNLDLLARQAAQFEPATLAIHHGDPDALAALIQAHSGNAGYRPEILTGGNASASVAGKAGIAVVLNAITGAIGLEPTLAALHAGASLALANKESLIIGGELVTRAAKPGQIVPVDSEHSAIAQALRSGAHAEVKKLILTASGGPFRGYTREQLERVTPTEALAHPTWDMGRMVTTNSASMVNKALEVIEAHLLFDVPLDAIEVVVHPQSVIHSMVEFIDGSTIAQASPPDMKLPIALGLNWPDRLAGAALPVDWTRAQEWTFEPLDDAVFPAVTLAKGAAARGGTYMAVYNAANEEAVDAFHEGLLDFGSITDVISAALGAHTPSGELTLESVLAADRWAREFAQERMGVRAGIADSENQD